MTTPDSTKALVAGTKCSSVIVSLCVLFSTMLFGIRVLYGNEAVEQLLPYVAVNGSFAELGYRPWLMISYAFFHGSPIHLVVNLLFLIATCCCLPYRFSNVKTISGIFLISSISGSLFYLFSPNQEAFLLGSSSGVMGIISWAAIVCRKTTYAVAFPGKINIGVLMLIFLVLSLSLTEITTQSSPFIAHLGGIVGGIVAWFLFSIFKAQNDCDIQFDKDTINEIIKKATQSGFASLTEAEKNTLSNLNSSISTNQRIK